jgi:hypothetical protein
MLSSAENFRDIRRRANNYWVVKGTKGHQEFLTVMVLVVIASYRFAVGIHVKDSTHLRVDYLVDKMCYRLGTDASSPLEELILNLEKLIARHIFVLID